LGGGFAGERLNKLYKESVNEEQILESLAPIIHQFAKEKYPDEHFGEFAIRKGYVKATTAGLNFHD
jgi:sulfite reductase (NADPH) hemoprotein beta-component